MDIGYNFKTLRILNKKTQEQVSKDTGISQKAISFWERNERTPNIIDCIKLADCYNVSLDELVGRDF